MPGLIIVGIIGLLIFLSAFFNAMVMSPANAIQQIYGAVEMAIAVLGLLVLAVSAGAGVIRGEIHRTHLVASAERLSLAEAMRLLAERKSAALKIPPAEISN